MKIKGTASNDPNKPRPLFPTVIRHCFVEESEQKRPCAARWTEKTPPLQLNIRMAHGEGPPRTFFQTMKSTYTTMNRYTHPAHSNIHDGHSSNHARPATVPHTGAFPVFSRWFFRWFPASKVKIATCFKKVVVQVMDQGRSNEHQPMPSNDPQKRSPVFPGASRDCSVDALGKKTL